MKKRSFLPQNIYVIFVAVSLGVYAISRFRVDALYIRYLYPIYLVLPYFLAVPFYLLKTRFKTLLTIVLFAGLAVGGNLKAILSAETEVRKTHGKLTQIIEAMDRTGERFWAGDYWQALLITGLTGERFITWDPKYHGMYWPYRLMFFNEGENNNYLFFNVPGSYAIKYMAHMELLSRNLESSLATADHIASLLKVLGIEAQDECMEDFGRLIYGLPERLTFFGSLPPIPPRIPELELVRISASRGKIECLFKNTTPFDFRGFRIRMSVPDYSSLTLRFSPRDETLSVSIPFPPQNEIRILYGLDYLGLPIPSTEREVSFAPDLKEIEAARYPIVQLSGFGPILNIHRWPMTVCEKEIRFELNGKIPKTNRLRIVLRNPFDFDQPFWYGDFAQEVSADLNGIPVLQTRLFYGRNTLAIPGSASAFREDRNFLTLKFRYHLPFDFARLWKTAALLEEIGWE